uniref:Putative transfer protein n=1 Tax=Stenotrophomonas maltophilia TaxID=40324 RepID=Q7WZM8_STEMA|nr:putative transfer protein [Stenotrophomonas maltophilia]
MDDMLEPSAARMALIEKIRARVAVEQHVLLGKNDPILSVVLIMEEVIKQYGEAIADDIQLNQEQLGIQLQTVVEGAKESAGKLITDSAGYMSKQMVAAGDQVKRDILQAASEIRAQATNDSNRMQEDSRRVHDQVHSMRTEVVDAKKGINLAMIVTVISAAIAVGASVIALLK